jgi:hypothetical protein
MRLFERYKRVAKAFGLRLKPFQSEMKSRKEWFSKINHEVELLVIKEAQLYFEKGFYELRHQLTKDEFFTLCFHMAIFSAMTNKRPNLKLRGIEDLPDWDALRDAGASVSNPKRTPPRDLGKKTKEIFNDYGREIRAMVLEGMSDGSIAKAISELAKIPISRSTIMRHRHRYEPLKIDP